MPKFSTAGYGILKGAHKKRKEAFQRRLQIFQERMGKPLYIFDIRRQYSGSINGKWFFQQGDFSDHGMRLLVKDMAAPIKYSDAHQLANADKDGRPFASLKKYQAWLQHAKIHNPAVNCCYMPLKWQIEDEDSAVILLCSELKPFKANGTSWNCHRVPLALELLKDLPRWEVEHL